LLSTELPPAALHFNQKGHLNPSASTIPRISRSSTFVVEMAKHVSASHVCLSEEISNVT
jgi:hypothetical protein